MLRGVVLISLVVASLAAIESNFYREESCANATGFCLLEAECPHAVSSEDKGLCSSQNKDGAVCCRNFPQQEVNCFQLHNACMDRCPDFLDLGRRGCPTGKKCCQLI